MYLIYLVAGEGKSIPTLSLIVIAAIYGVQALVFIMRRKWGMIGWVLFCIIAIPAFFFLPYTRSGGWTISLGVKHVLSLVNPARK